MRLIERLGERLEQLKVDYLVLLRREFMLVSDGRWSRWLSRKQGLSVGRYWATPETDELDNIERELAVLGRKLQDREALEYLDIPDRFLMSVQSARDQLDGGKTAEARKYLAEISRLQPRK